MAQFPQVPEFFGFTPVLCSAATSAALMVPSIPGVAGKMTYITGFDITGGGAASQTVVTVTLSGLAVNPAFAVSVVALGPSVPMVPIVKVFPQPIPASTMGGTVGISLPSFGAGNIAAAVNLYGFQA